MTVLEPDREQLAAFVRGIFCRVPKHGFVSLRSFFDDANDDRPVNKTFFRFDGATDFLIENAVNYARSAAALDRPVVFCPPIAVFETNKNAKEENLLFGPALSVECDKAPAIARENLEAILGTPTIVVRSGGLWTDPETGEIQDKLHLHWRLAEPAANGSLPKLKEARRLACAIVGGDGTNVNVVHPIRWPGSWHRKAEPRLCEIVGGDPEHEIDLAAALAALADAEPQKAKSSTQGGDDPRQRQEWSTLFRGILTGETYYPALLPLSAKLITSGMGDDTAVNLLRGLMEASSGPRDVRWIDRNNKIPGLVTSAREKLNDKWRSKDGPTPLFPPLPPAEPFPVDALGSVLSTAAAAIARKIQVPGAIAAQSVLATAALVAQAHADVVMPFGQAQPLSLYFVTVAASGDRKSSADKEALWPIRRREKTLKENYDHAIKAWNIAHSAWAAEKRKIENDRQLDFNSRCGRLEALGSEPLPPLFPCLTAPDPTIEGLIKNWPNLPAALGVFTAEGGQFVGGHGMRQEQVLKTAAAYSELWDGMAIKRVRALDGVSVLHGRRLSIHLMVQPEAAAKFLADATLRDQGFLSRMLVAAPDSIAGTRLYKDVDVGDDAAIRAYGARILHVCEQNWPLVDGRNELAPKRLTIGRAAEALYREFFDDVERALGGDGKYRLVRSHGSKIAEQAARIAGVLTIIDDVSAPEIGAGAMQNAIVLARWYLDEAVRLQQAARTDPKLLVADAVLKFLRGRQEREIRVRELMQLGPIQARTKSAAQEALETLCGHGWVKEICKRPYTVRLLDVGGWGEA